MQLFFNSNLNEQSSVISFSNEESKHIISVLRKKEKDILHITNGDNFLFKAKIISASPKICSAKIITCEKINSNKNYYLHIAIAPTKSAERFEWFIEKATEIGIDEITPIICKNSERKTIRPERLIKIMQVAIKQSLQFKLPKLNKTLSFFEFINQHFQGQQLFIAHCKNPTKTLKNEIQLNASYTLLIGPEGDFSEEEITKSANNNFKPITLSNNRLRTETAGITAVQYLSFLHQ
ncbi:MAG: 16S rRNA (uracil(1498)-N(3))-methyltransferase [Tenacibaculum sp.]